ncbi:MAG: respiratory nitrate reductase subunit gamma [Acidobacteria bacterium]|nr:respiratory nitrate reductase subunit gamma [Acidobacteriota bacterium]
MSDLLHVAEHRLQEVALLFMGVVYLIRLIWLFRWRAGRDRQPPNPRHRTSPGAGAMYSLANIALPWAMESTRRNPWLYIQFVTFHLGVTATIVLSFVIPYAPQWLAQVALVRLFQFVIGAAFLVGCLRLVRRATNPYVRSISTPDDYFSLVLLTIWFLFGVLAAPNRTAGGEWHLVAYFIVTAFFLVYVPFSKISHYLYYPFIRFYLGRTLGHRGVFPLESRSKTSQA